MSQNLPASATSTSNEPRAEMGFFEHLAELRYRILISAIAISIMAVVGYCYSEPIFAILNAPYYNAFPGEKLIGTGPAEAFVLKLKVSFFCGFLLASPIVLYQVWCFISPGLYEHEKKMVVPFVGVTTFLMASGICFGYYGIFPFAFQFFHEQYVSINVTPTIRMSEHLDAMITGLLGFAVVFQMPVVAFFLGRVGIITDRTLIDGVRYAIVAIFIIAAILTPPDVVTQFLFAGPLLILYGISILVLKYTQRKSEPPSEQSATT